MTNIALLQRTVEDQQKIITALQNELQWFNGVIFNPAFNEIEIRLMVTTTPREVRMGYASEAKEKKIYMPALAEEVHCSPKSVSKHIRTLSQAGVFSYRTEADPETGNTRAFLAPSPAVKAPADICIERAKRGGSVWENGKRVKRCKDCGSANLVTVSQIICADCGSAQCEQKHTPVNGLTPDGQVDTDPHSQYDSESSTDISSPTPDGHIDHEVAAGDEIPNLPPITVYTVGYKTEVVEPPEALRTLRIWCPRRGKVPYQTKGRDIQMAKSNDASTWSTYEEACAIVEKSVKWGWKEPFDGIGFMCDGTFTATDLDHCIEEGKMHTQASNRVESLDSYSEESPSGTGVHIIAWGNVPRNIKQPGCEMYDRARFMTWTGKHIIGTPISIEQRAEQLSALFAEISPDGTDGQYDSGGPATSDGRDTPCVYDVASDERTEEQLEAKCRMVLKKASNAANKAKFCALWDGDISAYDNDDSKADAALCEALAYWSDDDAKVMDLLFRQSKLYRPKWDRKARSGETYGEGTIRLAILYHRRMATA